MVEMTIGGKKYRTLEPGETAVKQELIESVQRMINSIGEYSGELPKINMSEQMKATTFRMNSWLNIVSTMLRERDI